MERYIIAQTGAFSGPARPCYQIFVRDGFAFHLLNRDTDPDGAAKIERNDPVELETARERLEKLTAKA